MRLFEYEGKEIFSRYGIPVPRSKLVHDAAAAASAARALGLPAVIKAQVLAGGRGKAGGVAMVNTREEAEREASRVLGLRIGGEATRALLVEESTSHMEELYLSISLDTGRREFVALASRKGGTDIESQDRASIAQVPVPLEGLKASAIYSLSDQLGLSGKVSHNFGAIVTRLERLSREEECEVAEINPLAVLRDGTFVALDAKVLLDDNALFRHPELSRLPPEDPLEGEAAKAGFALVRLGGSVVVMGNGAGLVMSTLDRVADSGGSAACFLDLGGGAQRETVESALRLVKRLPNIKAILVNIFGGITQTTDVADGLADVVSEGPIAPIFVRIRGAEEEEARSRLQAKGIPVFLHTAEAVRAAVEAALR